MCHDVSNDLYTSLTGPASGAPFSSDRQQAALSVVSLFQPSYSVDDPPNFIHRSPTRDATLQCVCSTFRLLHVHCRAHNNHASHACILSSYSFMHTQVRGFNPAEAVGFFGRKNPQHAFLRRGSKAVCPMSQICGM
jgi:hypothetical protein